MTLRSQITSDVADVFLNDEDFAESLYYKPECGEERTITAVVDEDGVYQPFGPDLNSLEYVDVFVSRDSATGIDDPQLGDAVARVIDGTGNDKKWYAWRGEKLEVDENAWTLRFVRDLPHTHGGIRRV